MRVLSAIPFLILVSSSLPSLGLEPVTVRSRSGQFLVRGLPLTEVMNQGAGATNVFSFVRLDPRLFAMACESIKAAVLKELAMADRWRGTVAVALHPNQRDSENIEIASIRYKTSWGYQVNVPERVDRKRLIKAMVQVVLMEIANRRAGEREAELPSWLGEGLTAQLMATTLADIALEPETTVIRRQHMPDALKEVREMLRTREVLGFNDLSQPEQQLLEEPEVDFYGSCAQLFLHELLHLKDGRRCLQQMLYELPEHLNWQTAFLRAFGGHFPRLLDADKWWALATANYQKKESSTLWGQTEIWRQLQEILTTTAEVRLKTGDLPMKVQVQLQNILTEWDYSRQVPVLQLKVNHLQALQLRVPRDLENLVNGYANTLTWYLGKRGAPKPDRNKIGRAARSAIAEALKRLNELDARVEALKNQAEPAAAHATLSP